MLVGEQQDVVTPGTNARRYLVAFGAESGQVLWASAERKTGARILAVLVPLLGRWPSAAMLHQILDNHGIHTSRSLQAALSSWAGRVRRYCLPPSCPTANRIERVWLDLHANITRNHRHADIDALVEAVHASLTARTIAIPHLRLAA